MKRAFIAILLGLTLSAITPAQNPPGKPAQTKPAAETEKVNFTVDQIFDKYVQALGGKAAIEKISTRVAKGNFEVSAIGLNAPAEIYTKAPNSFALVVTVPGFGLIQQGFNGSSGWMQDPQTGLRDVSGAELATLKRQAEFHRDLKFKEIYPQSSLQGKVKVGDREAYLVEAKTADGSLEKFYFDVQNGLLIRSDSEQETQQGKIPIEIYYEDYRDIDGIKMPFVTRNSLSSANIIIRLTEVKHNVPIDDAKFVKPSGK